MWTCGSIIFIRTFLDGSRRPAPGRCRRDRAPGGAPLGGVVGRHARQLGVGRGPPGPTMRDKRTPLKSAFSTSWLKLRSGKVARRIRVLARHRLEERQDVGAAGVDDERQEPLRVGQQRHRRAASSAARRRRPARSSRPPRPRRRTASDVSARASSSAARAASSSVHCANVSKRTTPARSGQRRRHRPTRRLACRRCSSSLAGHVPRLAERAR